MPKTEFYNDPSIKLNRDVKWEDGSSLEFKIREIISEALDIPVKEIILMEPANPTHGDYSTNIAMQKSVKYSLTPGELAEEMAGKIRKHKDFNKYFTSIEVLLPGFINLKLNKETVISEFNQFAGQQTTKGTQSDTKESAGSFKPLAGKRIAFEYAHPNPFKAFHIGHLRNIILGESLIRILEELGAEIIRTNYQGDVGMHIAKSIWGVLKLFKDEDKKLEDIDCLSSKERMKFLGKAYALGASAYENEKDQDDIKDLNYVVYAVAQEIEMKKYNWVPKVKYKDFIKSDKYDFEQIKQLWLKGVEWSLDYDREHIYKRVYSAFRKEYMESETQYYSEKNILEAIERGILVKSDGAYILPGKKFGLDTRVFQNSLGLPTYEGKELGLAPLQFTDFGQLDLNIHNVAVEQISFFKVTFKVEALLDPEKYEGRQYHNAYEFVGLKSGKMSSRTGKVVLGEDILNEAHERIKKIVSTREDFDKSKIEEVSETIGIGAVKYSFLNISPKSYLAFDLEKSLNFEGNSGPYLQYTFARANKIITDSSSKTDSMPDLKPDSMQNTKPDSIPDSKPEWKNEHFRLDPGIQLNNEELDLAKHLIKFDEIVLSAGKTLAPNLICTYLFELAQKFNTFYKTNPILKEKDSVKKETRLALTQATCDVLSKGLYMLGIKTIEKM